MTLERAIEILDPEGDWSGGTPNDVEEVKEACRAACEVMRKELAEQNARAERREKYEKMFNDNAAQILVAVNNYATKKE